MPKARCPTGFKNKAWDLGEGITVSSNSGGRWTEDFLEFKIMDHMSKALFPEQAVDCYICLKTYARPCLLYTSDAADDYLEV